MKESNVSEDDISAAIEEYADMVQRICFLYLRNSADAEDVFQEVFLKFFQNYGSLKDEEHRKAWLCRVTFNRCKDLTKSFWKRNVISFEEMEKFEIPFDDTGQEDLVRAVLELPAEYREIVYLHYYEGYTIPEIAAMLGKNPNTAYTRLRQAKELLRKKIGRI